MQAWKQQRLDELGYGVRDWLRLAISRRRELAAVNRRRRASRLQHAVDGARASGTPFISFFTPDDMLAIARDRLPLHRARSANALTERYFSGRSDGLRPPANAGELLVAST